MVPSPKLSVLKKRGLRNSSGQPTFAIIDIDETGRVAAVRSTAGPVPPDIEQTLKKWEFEPYKVNSVPVRVTTEVVLK
jgi:hypothetical protein